MRPSPLKFLSVGWYSVVMGLAGLALAWNAAVPLMGDMAGAAALVIGALAAAVFLVLAAAGLLRASRHPGAWAEDLRHPVRAPFAATLPFALMLLATWAVALGASGLFVQALWWCGVLGQLAVTWWIVGRWWQAREAGGQPWAGITPALFIPSVGNAVAAQAGLPLGHPEWSALQFGVALLLWPLVASLVVVRLLQHGPWPERMRPVVFVFVAPPSLVGLAALQFGAPDGLGWMCWGMAAFSAAWAARELPRIAGQPFGLAHWSMSFPLAALASLTLRLGRPGGALAWLGPPVLALVTLVVVALVLGTLRGLRDGSLLAPEPVAVLQPAG